MIPDGVQQGLRAAAANFSFMRRRLLALLLCLALVPTVAAEAHSDTTTFSAHGVTATIAADTVTLANGVVERVWTTAPFGTKQITDRRTGMVTGATPDFRLRLADGVELTGADFAVTGVKASETAGNAVRLTMTLTAPIGTVTRTVTTYPGLAGFETRTTLALAGEVTGYTLDEINTGAATPTIQTFAAGYDWRGSDSPDWEPTVAPFGGAHTDDHRVAATAPKGQALESEGEWLSLAGDSGQVFQVLERVNYASSRMAYDGTRGAARVDLNQDVIYAGPFESDVHLANPARLPLRQRVFTPVAPVTLEPVFTGFGLDPDDEAWQYAKYLQRRDSRWAKGDVVFNSNGVDSDRISTGAKDDMDLAEVKRQAAIAQRLGVDTFVLDDGWQAISGDWCPDSPQCPEPRKGTSPKFEARFPDANFTAVRQELGDMKLGLWMSPMHFNPASEAAKRNPGWICQPVGTATTAVNLAQPESGSNEAGIGQWNPEGLGQDGKLIDYIEGRIRRAVDQWGVRYFKFDFLAWADCGGAYPVTMYEYRESFVRMLDRLIASYPTVTFQIDETNDYRLFPFESVTRGPSWYANGNPKAKELLHNLWVLSPYVPGYTIGQAALGGDRGKLSTDYLSAIGLASHVSWFADLTKLTEEQITTAGRWADLYHRERERFTQLTYPLLDDPISGTNWTALQPWNADDQSGAVMVFRQDAEESTRTVPLRGIRGEGSYRLTDAETGAEFGTFTADQLRAGIAVTLPQRHSATVLLIDPA